MLRKLLAVTVAVGVLVSVSAASDLSYGVRASLNMGSVYGDDAPDDAKLGLGYAIGLGLRYPLAEKLALTPEFTFTYRSLYTYKESDFKYSIDEMALSIPVMVQYALTENASLFLTAGLQLDIPFGTKIVVKYDGETEKSDFDNRGSVDVSIPLGVGYMVTPNVGVDLRYVFGLTGLDDADVKFMNFGLGISYLF